MYASPRAVVRTLAVEPDIRPPIVVPTPGISFNRLVTIVLPNTVAPAAPIVDDTNDVKKLLLISNPKITVMDAIIPTCVGINKAASENGIGAKPSPNAPATATATAE